jgi:hypothetical protein
MLSLLLFTVIAPAMAQGAGTTPLFASLSGKALVAVSETHPYQVVAIGGPGEGTGGNYSFQFDLVGSSKTDGKVLPDSGSSKTGRYTVNVTASSFAEDLTLKVKVNSYNATSSINVTKNLVIKVVKPIVITAKVVNQGNATLTGVPVTFYVDDVKLYNTTIALTSKTTKTVVYNWTSQTVSNGEHSVRVELDPNSQFVRFSSGGTIFTQTIWVGPSDYSSSDGVLIGLFVLLLLVTYMVYKRPTKRRKK